MQEIVNFFQQKMHVCFTEEDRLRADAMEGEQFNPASLSDVSSKQTFRYLQMFAEKLGKHCQQSDSCSGKTVDPRHELLPV